MSSIELKTVAAHSQELTAALSSDPIYAAGALIDKKFIQARVLLEMCGVSTPVGKATVLVESVRKEIESAPEKLIQFLEILSEVACAKEVVESLRSTYQKTIGAILVTLSEKDLVDLMRLLQSYSYKWNPIGLSLGFTQHELNNIFSMFKLLVGAPVSYLQELLSQWLQWPTEEHQNNPTLGALCTALRSSLVGLSSLAEEVEKEMKQYDTGVAVMHCSSESDKDVSCKIEELEGQFRGLHSCILKELKENKALDIQEVLHALTLLPTKLRNEYQKLILDKLPTLRSEKSISELFLHLNPLFSFIDYSLLEYIINIFGSTGLKDRMKLYCREVQNFMSRTTVQQLIDYWPREEEIAPNISKMVATIKRDPQTCNLVELDVIRRNVCIRARLFDVICAVVSIKNSHSFIVIWGVPSVLAPDMIKSLELADGGFFEKNDIHIVSVDDKLVYSPLSKFSVKVRKQYRIVMQTTVSHAEWITSPTRKIFRLAMIQRERVQHGRIDDQFVKMTITGKIDDILHCKTPIELKNIFNENRQVILIEGAPGSGKTTLTIFICQKWGKGELFQQFTVVILVQLRDPAVQKAQTVADLLPIENAAVAQELATELLATNGRGVLWVLDGWDELPPHLQQDSIFCKLLPPKPSEQKLAEIEKDPVYRKHLGRKYSKVELWLLYLQNNPVFRAQYYTDRFLNEASIIVTSRPISSGDLHPVISSRIEVLGFTPEEQRQYFTECLKGDTKALEVLLDKIQENPLIQSICYLPLNAAFIVHTFKYRNQSLPNTEFEIYLSIILSCIQRHLGREGRDHDLPREIASLDDLSRNEAVREPFHCLCELAYCGVMENKVTFSSSDLPQGSNTLSLLQVIESFLQSGKSVFYNFLHLSIQEVLSAYYITTELSDSEQVSQFQQLFNQPRFAAVFQFYAAITKLKSAGIHQIIDRTVEAKSKPLLVSLLRCLYEAQDPSLCLYVAERLKYKLNLRDTSLSPLDCLSVSFFLSSVTGKVTSVHFNRCTIGDLGAKCLSKYLHSDNNLDYLSKITIGLAENEIHEEGALHISKMVYFIEHLYLANNPIGDIGASLISEVVRENATLKTLILYTCSITARGAEELSRALAQNSSLEKLDIGWNNLGDEGISHIAEALKQNKQLKELWIGGGSGMTDKGAASLASALTVNNSLKMLHIGGGEGALTEKGLSAIIHSLANKPLIVKLAIPEDFGSTTTDRLSWKVNEERKRNGLPPIEIEATEIDSESFPSRY